MPIPTLLDLSITNLGMASVLSYILNTPSVVVANPDANHHLFGVAALSCNSIATVAAAPVLAMIPATPFVLLYVCNFTDGLVVPIPRFVPSKNKLALVANVLVPFPYGT